MYDLIKNLSHIVALKQIKKVKPLSKTTKILPKESYDCKPIGKFSVISSDSDDWCKGK